MASTTTSPNGLSGYDEVRYRWADVVPREAVWNGLSPQAREAFLYDVKPAVTIGTTTKPLTSTDHVLGAVREELLAVGFIELTKPVAGKTPSRIFVPDAVIPFSNRVRDLLRYRLLGADGATKLSFYCKNSFDTRTLASHAQMILQQSNERKQWYANDDCFDWSVRKARWPEMVAKYLNNPIVRQVLDVLWDAEQPLTYADLAAKFEKDDAIAIRQAVRRLRSCLAVFEDLEPDTNRIVVGLLPEVRQDRAKRISASTDFELRPSNVLVEHIPTAGLWIDDLRAILIEIANEPPKLKANGMPYKKDEDRLIGALPHRHTALEPHSRSVESRMSSTIDLARKLKFCDRVNDARSVRLAIAKPGEEWMGGSLVEAYTTLFKQFQPLSDAKARIQVAHYGNPEEAFFGCDARAVRRKEENHPNYYYTPNAKDLTNLAPFVWGFFKRLTPNAFYPLESLQRKFGLLTSCPLLVGKGIGEVDIFFGYTRLKDIESELPARAVAFFLTHLVQRLLMLGCVKVGVDREGHLHFARTILLDAYYGKHTLTDQDLDDPNIGSKVIVQPDYSIVVIGKNVGPVAQLATFCERVRGSVADGSVTLRITRDSVVKAVQRGTKPASILERLKKLANNAIPKNVEHEVNEWGNWVRTIDVALRLVIQCPDRDTADRAIASLRQNAERLSERVIALNIDALTTKQTADLKKEGIVVIEREIARDDDDDD